MTPQEQFRLYKEAYKKSSPVQQPPPKQQPAKK
jgi:hypothetical protein